MQDQSKVQQLQIRVSPAQKLAIRQHAARAGMSMSEWVLHKVLPSAAMRFQALLHEIASSEEPGYPFAELLELIEPMAAGEFEEAVSEPPEAELGAYWQNYVAATLEHAAARKGAAPPAWARDVEPLDEPVFASSLQSLRLHLLTQTPAAFLRRNLFVDATAGDRV